MERITDKTVIAKVLSSWIKTIVFVENWNDFVSENKEI